MKAGHFEDLLALGGGASLEYNQNETFIDAFLRQVEKTPDATAVVDDHGSITGMSRITLNILNCLNPEKYGY